MTKHTTTEDLRAALKAAIPDLTNDQFRAAQALLGQAGRERNPDVAGLA